MTHKCDLIHGLTVRQTLHYAAKMTIGRKVSLNLNLIIHWIDLWEIMFIIPGFQLREGRQGEAGPSRPRPLTSGIKGGGGAHAERIQEVKK